MNPIQAALMAKYNSREYRPRYNTRSQSRKIHLRFPVASFLFPIAIIFLLVALPVVYSSSPSSRTVVQDWTNNRSINLGSFGAWQSFSSAPADSEIGNCFTTPETTSNFFTISDIEFRLNGAVGLPANGQLQTVVYSTFGSVQNSTCVPNFSTGQIASSSSTNPSMIGSTTTGNVTFNFLILPAQLTLQGNTTYAVSLRLVGCSDCNPANYWVFGVDATNMAMPILSFRVGSMNLTSAPLSPSIPASFSSYYWNRTAFVPNLPLVITGGGTGGAGGGGSGRILKT